MLVVLYNCGGFIKASIDGDLDPVAVVLNCLGRPHCSNRWLVTDQLLSYEGPTSISLRRPFNRGYLINPDPEKEIRDYVFHSILRVGPAQSSLLLVERLFNLPSIQRATDELVFEDFGFKCLYVAVGVESMSPLMFYAFCWR